MADDSGVVSLWDIRSGSRPQLTGEFPGTGIRHLSGNPFLSDLWAISGDGVVSIMDMRTFTPLVSLGLHCNSVSKVLWSPSHSDMLVSVSLDRYIRYWSLSKPGYCITSESFASGVIDVEWVPTSHSGRCYAVGLNGELASLELDRSTLLSLAPH
jgi:WD40 repeat protein